MDEPSEQSVPLGDEYLAAKAARLAQYRADKARQARASHPALWEAYQADLATLDGQWETESTRLVAAYEAAKSPLWAQYCAARATLDDLTAQRRRFGMDEALVVAYDEAAQAGLWEQYETDTAVLRRHVLTQFAPFFTPSPPEDREEAP